MNVERIDGISINVDAVKKLRKDELIKLLAPVCTKRLSYSIEDANKWASKVYDIIVKPAKQEAPL